ncbi:MAG: extracellular solute-binding protein [Oscillospiraceae bacterium]|nr:extracellular solute-binding protein [Oscillospiraceae bacterium]
MKKLALVAAVSMVLCCIGPFVPAGAAESKSPASQNTLDYLIREGSYSEYRAQHENAAYPDREILLKAEDALSSEEAETSLTEGTLLWSNERGTVSWSFSVEESGIYYLKLRYRSANDTFSDILRTVQIDGKVPFEELEQSAFSKMVKNRDEEIQTDNQGNQLRPTQVVSPQWQEAWVRDDEGIFADPFGLYFEAGEHTVELVGVSQPMEIEWLKLCQYPKTPTYESYAQSVAGKEDRAEREIRVQAEEALWKSSPSLYPLYARDNCYNEPFSVQNTIFNAIGGYNWRSNGDWAEWEFDVETSGYYKMGIRFKQDFLMGIPIVRRIQIDGEYLFEELESFALDYDTAWQMATLQSGQEECYIWLEEGHHTLRLTAALDEISVAVYNIRQITVDLLDIYSRIIMITGVTPDTYRDYQLAKRLPTLTEELQSNVDALRDMAAYIRYLSGGEASEAHSIERVYEQIETMIADPDDIPAKLSYFKDNITTLSSWILTASETCATIDYITFLPKNMDYPQVNPGFFEQLWSTLESFWVSFFKDYSKVGNSYDATEAISVWTLLGREQADTFKTIVDDSFTPKYDLNVNMNIIANEGVLLFSVAAGNPPDVALGLSQQLPVDYGLREAVLDLSTMDTFSEVVGRFSESAVSPFAYEGATYAIPHTQSFPIMFCRTDVLDNLGIAIPKTWDDFFEAVQTLQERNLTTGVTGLLDTLIFQNGCSYYNDAMTACVINSPEGLKAFQTYTSFYTDYSLPLEYDAVNRFRTGEMPIFIADYSSGYNTMTISAPEIKGLWTMAPVPGTVWEDGTIDGSVAGVTTSIVIFSTTKNQEASWRFIDWWTSDSVQVRYGNEVEAIMGAGARYNSANLEAMKDLPWKLEDLEVLSEQWETVKGVPMIPGSYYTTRHLDNAFREVYTYGELPRNSLTKYVLEINKEITKKRQEFNLSTEQ